MTDEEQSVKRNDRYKHFLALHQESTMSPTDTAHRLICLQTWGITMAMTGLW